MKLKNRVLAVLALTLLIINMLPVRVAEAAETIPETITLKWGSGTNEVSTAGYQYYMVFYGANKEKLFLSNSPLVGKLDSDGSIVVCVTPSYISSDVKVVGWSSNKEGAIYSPTDSGSLFIPEYTSYNSNYDFKNGDTGALLLAAKPFMIEYDYVYSSSGPVAALWSAGISRWMQFIPPDADDIEDFYVKSNWAAQPDKCKYSIIYRLIGELPALSAASPTDGSMYKLHTESVIAFPSKELVTGWISSGLSPVELYFDKAITDWHQTVYDGKDSFVEFKVTNESIPSYHSLQNGSHLFQVDIPMTDIIAAIDGSLDGGLRGYYGLSTEMWELWKNSIYSYKLPLGIYTVLYAKEDVDTMVYGNMYYGVPNWTDIDQLIKGYVFTGGVIEKPLEDITDSDKQEIQMDTTRAELAKRTEELEQLKKEYEEALKLNGNDEDVFSLFSKFTNGLRSSTGSFKSLSLAIGNVFAFFPEDITSLLYGGIIIMIVIAIYKAIRG